MTLFDRMRTSLRNFEPTQYSYLRKVKGRKTVRIDEVGEFPCPHCQLDRSYTLTAIQETHGFLDRFVVTPTGGFVETAVRCDVCDQRFPGDIRDRTLFRDRGTEEELVNRLRQNLGGSTSEK